MFKHIILAVCMLVGATFSSNGSTDSPKSLKACYGSVYAVSVRKWNNVYMPEVPYQWIIAQMQQESRCKADAVSPVNAQGLMQIMLPTWADLERKLGVKGDAFDSSLNIQLGTAYMRQMRTVWSKNQLRTHWEIHQLALAGYNSGTGNVLKSQAKCNNAALWKDISPCMYKVTGAYSKETLTYVERIDGNIKILESIEPIPFVCTVGCNRSLGR